MAGLELIYRTANFIQMTIKVRLSVDSFNVYQSVDNVTYNLLLNVPNKAATDGENKRRFLGRAVFSFDPTLILNWDNAAFNYIKIAPVVGGVEGTVEDAKAIPPVGLDQSKMVTNKVSLHAWNDSLGVFVPLKASDDFKLEVV